MITKSGPWRLALATVTGTSHKVSGAPCQDYAGYRLLSTAQDDVLVVVVCDGAGSASHAEVGAQLSATSMLRLIEVHFENGNHISDIDSVLARDWIAKIADIIVAEAVSKQRSSRDYSCTLLTAIVGKNQAAFLQIGDGAIVISRGDEEDWTYLFWPQHGEFANTTNFVVSSNSIDSLDFAFVPERIEELALFSDGIENLVLHHATRTVFEPFFRQMMPPVRVSTKTGLDNDLSASLVKYLESPVVCARTDDDKTLVLASRLTPVQ